MRRLAPHWRDLLEGKSYRMFDLASSDFLYVGECKTNLEALSATLLAIGKTSYEIVSLLSSNLRISEKKDYLTVTKVLPDNSVFKWIRTFKKKAWVLSYQKNLYGKDRQFVSLYINTIAWRTPANTTWTELYTTMTRLCIHKELLVTKNSSPTSSDKLNQIKRMLSEKINIE